MKFLNYVIELPDKEIKVKVEEKEEGWTVENLFLREINNFFRKIEDKEKLKEMKFDEKKEMMKPRNSEEINLLKNGDSQKED